jgi:hypothetical protein
LNLVRRPGSKLANWRVNGGATWVMLLLPLKIVRVIARCCEGANDAYPYRLNLFSAVFIDANGRGDRLSVAAV